MPPQVKHIKFACPSGLLPSSEGECGFQVGDFTPGVLGGLKEGQHVGWSLRVSGTRVSLQ